LNTATAQISIVDRLGSTMFLAALAHGVVILGITFTIEPVKQTEALPTLNVTLLMDTDDTERPAEQAELLAATSQLAGGRLSEGLRPTTVLSADHPTTRIGDPSAADLEDGKPRESAPQADQLVTRSQTDNPVTAVLQATDTPANTPTRAAALIEQPSPQTLAMEVDLEAALPENSDRDGLASPSASESVLAEYLVGWRQRVERVGTANFPERFLSASQASGRPTLEVAIEAQGRLEEIVVRRSSGDRMLDEAALNILRLAAPFEPLPGSILAEYDVLRFAYEWDFSTGQEEMAATELARAD